MVGGDGYDDRKSLLSVEEKMVFLFILFFVVFYD